MTEDRGQRRGHLELQHGQVGPQVLEHVVEDVVEGHRREGGHRLPGLGQQQVDGRRHPCGAAAGTQEQRGGLLEPVCLQLETGDVEGELERGEGGAQVVADGLGEAREPGVGSDEVRVERAEAAAAQLQLEHVDDALGQHGQPAALLVVDDARLGVEDAQRADRHRRGRPQLEGGVEAHAGGAGDPRVVAEALVGAGVGQHEWLVVVDDDRAHGVLARGHRSLEANALELVLVVLGQQVERRHRDAARLGGQGHEAVQLRAGVRVSAGQSVVAQRLLAPLLVPARAGLHVTVGHGLPPRSHLRGARAGDSTQPRAHPDTRGAGQTKGRWPALRGLPPARGRTR